jgi:hypothetical protein
MNTRSQEMLVRCFPSIFLLRHSKLSIKSVLNVKHHVCSDKDEATMTGDPELRREGGTRKYT